VDVCITDCKQAKKVYTLTSTRSSLSAEIDEDVKVDVIIKNLDPSNSHNFHMKITRSHDDGDVVRSGGWGLDRGDSRTYSAFIAASRDALAPETYELVVDRFRLGAQFARPGSELPEPAETFRFKFVVRPYHPPPPPMLHVIACVGHQYRYGLKSEVVVEGEFRGSPYHTWPSARWIRFVASCLDRVLCEESANGVQPFGRWPPPHETYPIDYSDRVRGVLAFVNQLRLTLFGGDPDGQRHQTDGAVVTSCVLDGLALSATTDPFNPSTIKRCVSNIRRRLHGPDHHTPATDKAALSRKSLERWTDADYGFLLGLFEIASESVTLFIELTVVGAIARNLLIASARSFFVWSFPSDLFEMIFEDSVAYTPKQLR